MLTSSAQECTSTPGPGGGARWAIVQDLTIQIEPRQPNSKLMTLSMLASSPC